MKPKNNMQPHCWLLASDAKFLALRQLVAPTEIAAAEGMDVGQASRIARLALLSARSVEGVVDGGIALAVDKALKLSADWGESVVAAISSYCFAGELYGSW